MFNKHTWKHQDRGLFGRPVLQ